MNINLLTHPFPLLEVKEDFNNTLNNSCVPFSTANSFDISECTLNPYGELICCDVSESHSDLPSETTSRSIPLNFDLSMTKSLYLKLLSTELEPENKTEFEIKIRRLLKDRVFRDEEEINRIHAWAMKRKEKKDMIRKLITPHQRELMTNNFLFELNSFKYVFDQVEMPIIVWEECFMIHYMNRSFRDLTKYPKPLPNDLKDFSFLYLLSPVVSHQLVSSFYGEESRTESAMIPCSLRDYRETEHENYIHGTLSVTVKRDIFDMPMFFLGCFLPNPQTVDLNTYAPKVKTQPQFAHNW